LHREVRRRLRELDVRLDGLADRELAAELRGATTLLRELLASHFPLGSSHCPSCRTRLGRAAPWPCHVRRTTHSLLVHTP
jgi:hypothetical protein